MVDWLNSFKTKVTLLPLNIGYNILGSLGTLISQSLRGLRWLSGRHCLRTSLLKDILKLPSDRKEAERSRLSLYKWTNVSFGGHSWKIGRFLAWCHKEMTLDTRIYFVPALHLHQNLINFGSCVQMGECTVHVRPSVDKIMISSS